MAAKNSRNKVLESTKTHWQSTPAARTNAPTKNTFEDKMPFTNPLSPVLQQDQNSEEKKYDSKKHTILEMIAQAIEALGAGKKGSSIPAIKKWILGNYMGIDSDRLNLHIRKALTKGLESGVLERAIKSAQLTGAKGYFVVKPKGKTAIKKIKKDPKQVPATITGGGLRKGKGKAGHVSDSEITIIKPDRRKSAKLHVSDTDLQPDSTIQQMKTKPKKTAAIVDKADPKKAKIEKKPAARKTSKDKNVEKANGEIKVEKQGKVKADLGIASSSKDKKVAEKSEPKKKEKPAKKVPAKPKKGNVDSSKEEQSTLSKRPARNK